MLGARLNPYAEIAVDVAVAFAAYHWLGWIGLALWAFFVISWFCSHMLKNQAVIMTTLLSRLPDRCATCHREIVDEGGVYGEDGIYHAACSDKLASLEELRKEAGVPIREAIHRPRLRSQASM